MRTKTNLPSLDSLTTFVQQLGLSQTEIKRAKFNPRLHVVGRELVPGLSLAASNDMRNRKLSKADWETQSQAFGRHLRTEFVRNQNTVVDRLPFMF